MSASVRESASVVAGTPLPRLGGRTRVRWRSRSGEVVTHRVEPLALAHALRLAGGDRRRLEFVDATTVLVLNRPRG